MSFFYVGEGGGGNFFSRWGGISESRCEKNNRHSQSAGRYQIRVRVPASLKSLAGRREVRKTLGTADYREALRRGLPILERLENLFREMRGPMTEATVADICQRFRHNLKHFLSPADQARQLAKLTREQLDQVVGTGASMAGIVATSRIIRQMASDCSARSNASGSA